MNCQPVGHGLFVERDRVDPSLSGEEESTWAFLDRVDDPAFDRVRRIMNAWFCRYPASERAALRGRLASGDNVEFHSAWFELYLHELHRRLGFDVTVEPVLQDVTARPDFLLRRGGEGLLLEATVVGDRQESGRAGRIARIVASLNRTTSPDFTLLFEIDAEGERAPPMRDVRRRLESWLAKRDWHEVRAEQERQPDLARLPTRTDRVGDWAFSFRAWPRRPEQRGQPGPAISAGPSEGGIFDHGRTLLDPLEDKARKYGTPALPLIIAVRLDRLHAWDEDVLVALVGPAIHRLAPSGPTMSTGRRGTGLFRHASGRWRNTHIAGVLVWDIELRPWSVTRSEPTLWLHPHPRLSLASGLPWKLVRLDSATAQPVDGTFDPGLAFRLPDGRLFRDAKEWPGTPFADLR